MAPTKFHRAGSCDKLLQNRGVLGDCIGEGAYAKVIQFSFFQEMNKVKFLIFRSTWRNL